MCLEVIAASQIRLIDREVSDQESYEQVYLASETGSFNTSFPTIFVHPPTSYREYYEDLQVGVYRVDGAYYGRKAGSYTASYRVYGEWLNELAHRIYGVDLNTILSNPRQYRGQPFYLLFDYKAVEGFIGPNHAGIIALDFQMYAAHITAQVRRKTDADFVRSYGQLGQAFTIGADQGLVQFS